MIGCSEMKASVWPDEESSGWIDGATAVSFSNTNAVRPSKLLTF